MGIAPIPAALAFTAGVLLIHAAPVLPSAAALLALCAPAFTPWRGRALWSVAALGVLLTVLRAQGLLEQRWPAARHGSDHEVEGFVASLPERGLDAQRFLFEPKDPRLPRRIRVSWYRAETGVRGAECWRFTLRLRTPHGSLNPGGFDYEGWLFRQGIGATATVRGAQRCAGHRGEILRMRQRIVERLRTALPDSAAAGVLAALTVGDDSAIIAADWELFRRTGTTHLVAISGFNIAIVAAVAFFACRWLWALRPSLCLTLPAPRAGLAGSALCAGAYALLAGFEPPVQRAVLMLWLILAAVWLHRASKPSRVLALAWLAVLAPDPLALSTPGLWLSFGAVAVIFYVALGRLRPPGRLHALVLLQLAIGLALAPLTLLFFHGGSWIGPLVNLFAVPFFALLTPPALAAVLLHLASPALGQPVLEATVLALDAFRAALSWAAQAPDLWIPASPAAAALLLAVAGIVLLLVPRGVPLRPLGALCLLPMLLVRPSAPRGSFELTALDVGQGLAVVVRTARHTLLYDAGPAFADGFDAGASVVAPFLLQAGVRDVDLLIRSHGDNDHAGGIAAVRRLLHVHREIGTGGAPPCRAGEAWEWDGVRFEVLHPDVAGGEGNDASCVLRVAGTFVALLPGDIERAAEQRLVEVGAPLRADVLLAPHHGSRTSSSPAFVGAVQPYVVIHSAGWRHPFRHPRAEVVARYAAAGARQYVTGSGGTVTVWRDEASGRIEAREHRREAARFWNAQAGP
ncbi:MAG: DNA internalization-related competence protein ComEC/Rec2 [Nevskiaceae bacterium]